MLNHLEFLPDHLCVFVPRAENDKGSKVCIKKLFSKYCPVGNCEEELPKKSVGRLSVDCQSTVGQQITDRLPTVSKIENLL